MTGDLAKNGSLGIDELVALGAQDFTWEHNGEEILARGVPMEAVLRRFGWDIGPGGKEAGPAERRAGWRCAVLTTSWDGYRTTFSAAEVTAENGPTKAFLVWEQGGQPLDQTLGPIRLLVTTDKKGSRSVRQLAELHVVDLGK